MPEILVSAERLRALTRRIFVAAGCSDEESARIAHYLVLANLTGHDSHGVIRIPRYLDWMSRGWLKPGQTPTVVVESEAMVLLEGHYGFGQTLGPRATEIGIRKAEVAGTAIVALRHSGHLGRIGDFAEMAAAAGLVSIHFVNVAGSTLVAPFGGRERRMGTNPITIGVPLPDEPPLILDFATSAVAEGKAIVAHSGGKPLPEGSLIDENGRLSSDPTVFYGPKRPGRIPHSSGGRGAIRAMGEHKGSGLSLMIELLAGALTGSGCAGPPPRPDKGAIFDARGDSPARPVNNGMLSIFLKPAAFAGEDAFVAEARSYVEFFKSSKPALGADEILTPGEPERRTRARREAEGIPLPEETWAIIVAAGEQVGLDRRSIEGAD